MGQQYCMYVYHYAECTGFTVYSVRYHMPDTGIMLLLNEHIGNELKQNFFVAAAVVVIKLQCGWF